MKPELNVAIRATGWGIPEQVITNQDIERRIDTSDEWITTRTGIKERRYTSTNETTLTMGLSAAQEALSEANMSASELDMIIFCTISPHYHLPSTACMLQAELGARQIPALDMAAACSGFLYGLNTAAHYVHLGHYQNILVIGAENLTRLMDWEDRATCILFGDGAGAAIVSRTDDPNQGILHHVMGADGSDAEMIWIPGGGGCEPFSQKVLDERLHYIRMKGREVYKFAVNKMHEIIDQVLQETGIHPADLALVIPHQSNLRIIESARERLGIPPEKMMVNIDRFGNTSAASVGICLHEARQTGRIKRGDLLLMVAFGAGLTWASSLIRL